ncbi:MAG TPA: YfiR family protein [Nitrospirota bacterium]|nr:YfiR family protein [Nitrospirota bacterium]
MSSRIPLKAGDSKLPRGRSLLLVLAWLCSCLFAASHAAAQPPKPTEYQIKAAFLYNFAKFVDWPEDSFHSETAPFVFGILGDDPFGDDVDALTMKTINSRAVKIRRMGDVREARACHVLFISSSEEEHIEQILRVMQTSRTLLVSDISNFAAQGGMINFIVKDNNVRFVINRAAMVKAGINLHSRLLKMAVMVYDSQDHTAN